MYYGKKVSNSDYSCIHDWLIRHYGNANICCNHKCGLVSKKFDWALKSEKTYEKKIENFFQLCRSCHKKYDMKIINDFNFIELNLQEIPSGRTSKHLRRPIKVVGTNMVFNSIIEASKIMNISRQSISHVLGGRRKTGYGFKFEYARVVEC